MQGLAGPGGSTLYVLQRHIQLPTRVSQVTANAAVGLDAAELRAAVWRFARALVPLLLLVGALLTGRRGSFFGNRVPFAAFRLAR
ncbi:MAG: hypothetical protein ABWY38_00310 [Methyloceanibacter sp.]